MNWHRCAGAATAALIALAATACTSAGPGVPGVTTAPARPSATPGQAPTGTFPEPVPSRLAATVMLQGADLPGATIDDQPHDGFYGTLAYLVDRCKGVPELTFESNADRDRSFQYSDGRSVYQRVIEYVGVDAVLSLGWYRTVVAACPQCDPCGSRTLRIIAEKIAGEESIIVEDSTPAERDLHVFVRVGNRLTEIILRPADDALGRELAQRAASHL
jgi:hypothetical protein